MAEWGYAEATFQRLTMHTLDVYVGLAAELSRRWRALRSTRALKREYEHTRQVREYAAMQQFNVKHKTHRAK